ncbi:MAG TPA: YacL family protein [Thermoanaerobaculia bacterium]|nr:YacL family protein [Thermoanaerobaculia bacterium]
MELEFYWDGAGDPRARCKGKQGETLAGFLEGDLQGSARQARAILRAIDRIEAGKLDDWETTGNSYTLTLSAKGASLLNENEEDAVPVELPLSQLKDAVAGWTAFVDEG